MKRVKEGSTFIRSSPNPNFHHFSTLQTDTPPKQNPLKIQHCINQPKKNMTISQIIFIWVFVIFTIISANGVNTQPQPPKTALSASPGPGTVASDCVTLIYNMSDCLTYVEKGSNVSKPDKQCCPELAGMLDSNPICLCHLLGKSKDFPVELNVSKALRLPGVCGLETPIDLCSGVQIEGPAGSPTSSQGRPTSSDGPSADLGEHSPGKNAASNAHFRLLYLVAALAIAVTSSTL